MIQQNICKIDDPAQTEPGHMRIAECSGKSKLEQLSGKLRISMHIDQKISTSIDPFMWASCERVVISSSSQPV